MTFRINEEVVPVGKAAQAQARRDRARDARLEMDPDQLARERRIDEASVDVEVAWEERAQAEQAVADAEVAAAIERLFAERLAVKDVVHLTGLDQATVRRLRLGRGDRARFHQKHPRCPTADPGSDSDER